MSVLMWTLLVNVLHSFLQPVIIEEVVCNKEHLFFSSSHLGNNKRTLGHDGQYRFLFFFMVSAQKVTANISLNIRKSGRQALIAFCFTCCYLLSYHLVHFPSFKALENTLFHFHINDDSNNESVI